MKYSTDNQQTINPVTCPHCGNVQTDELGVYAANLKGKRGLIIHCDKCGKSWLQESKS